MAIYRCQTASQLSLFIGFLISWISLVLEDIKWHRENKDCSENLKKVYEEIEGKLKKYKGHHGYISMSNYFPTFIVHWILNFVDQPTHENHENWYPTKKVISQC
jgi:hypothetical protein